MSVTTILLPAGTPLLEADWSVSGTQPTAHQALALDDGVTSIITATTHAGDIAELDMDALPALATHVETFLTRTSTQGAATGSLNFYARLSGVDGALALTLAGTPGYTTSNGATPRPGGGSWSALDVSNATARIRDDLDGGSGGIAVSYLAWVVTWSPSPGDFAAFAGSIVGPLLGVALGLWEMPLLCGAILARSRHRIGPESYRTLYDELRAPSRRYA